MTDYATMQLPAEPTTVAPDGSDVRMLLALDAGSMAHFTLASRRMSNPVRHRTVEEIWFVVSGRGEMWREQDGREEIVALAPGVCLSIPVGTRFQFRALGPGPLSAIGVTMPPWPGDAEAIAVPGCPRW